MQYYFRHLITAILGITVLQSCIVTTTVEEINEQYKNYERISQRNLYREQDATKKKRKFSD